MKKSLLHKTLLFGAASLMAAFAFAAPEKVVQIFKNGEIIQEYPVSEIDYIEVNDLVAAPSDLKATVTDKQITIIWQAVEDATYNVYRSGDNVSFTLIASGLTETRYTDTAPLPGTNYYRVKSVVNEVESTGDTSVAATLASTELASGIYLGVTAFNQAIQSQPVLALTEGTIGGFRDFIDGLTTKYGTLLYYSVDQALNTMQTSELPADISTAAIVTFTDGLDQGSMMMGVPYEDNMAYLDALNQRIKTETVADEPISAYSIGIRGKDVADIDMFRANLSKLASSPENAMEVTSMSEVNAKFREIASQLSKSNYIQTINLTIPGLSNGTRVRFTFDNVNSAENSQLYIEGKFNLKERSLEEVEYVGLSSTSGTTIKGTVDGIFVTFKFEGVHTDNNALIKKDFTDEWNYIASNSTWQINSEFDKTENSDIVTERSSAVIMLVLDCSSSLADDFVRAQANAKDFVNTLYEAAGGSLVPEEDETIYSTTPTDLSAAIWKNGVRYYLTPEQFKKANLKDCIVEGLTVLSNMGNFIISPTDLVSNTVNAFIASSYYADKVPDYTQSSVISARYIDINQAFDGIGWSRLANARGIVYLTTTDYNAGSNWVINLYDYSGGALGHASAGLLRGVSPILEDSPICWQDERDLSLAVVKDGKRMFIKDGGIDLSQFDEIEGLVVVTGDEKFIIKLHDEQSGVVNIYTAMSLYGDILPTGDQATVISARFWDINDALTTFGGDGFISSNYYVTKTTYNADSNWLIHLYNYKGGSLDHGSSGCIRGVKLLE